MKYTIEFTEVIAYLSQDIEADSKDEAIEKAFERFGKGYIPLIEEDPADRDDRLYHEEQDHIAMEKAKENK